MSKVKKKQNVILTDFYQSENWSFRKHIEKATNEEWTGISLTSNKDFFLGGGYDPLFVI